jgi:hypothetical protein
MAIIFNNENVSFLTGKKTCYKFCESMSGSDFSYIIEFFLLVSIVGIVVSIQSRKSDIPDRNAHRNHNPTNHK